MSATQEYLTLCCREQWEKGRFFHTRCQGDSLCLEPGEHLGRYELFPVDSGESGFAWSRVKLEARLPRDAAVRVFALAGDRPEREGDFGPPCGTGTDFYLGVTGRYLWLALELTGASGESPLVSRVSIRMSGDHMVDYLPAIYQEQDFTYRFLSIFNSLFQDMEDAIDSLPRLLDLDSAPPEMLAMLARWLCVDPWDVREGLRQRLKHILEEYENMYTVEGVKSSARWLTGREAQVIEHFAVDPNDPSCRNPELYRRLYGEDPYRFFLLLGEDAFADRDSMERFLERMEERIPAGTELELVLLKNRVQLDWHTYLGINSRVGGYIPATIDERVTIHYDTTIGGAEHE